MRPSGRVSADGLPSVIMMICRMSFRWDMSMRRDSLSPSAVLVWYGPTCARASCARGISSAVSWNSTTRSVSPGNCVRMRWVRASATFFAGVKRSSPYRIIECEQSSISTVADEDRYSAWWTRRSRYSRLMGTPRPSRLIAFSSVALTSRFSTSPYSYCLHAASASMPVARCSVPWAPKLLEHLGSQLARVHERLEDRLAQRVERAVGLLVAELAPEGVGVRASGEARLQQEVGELVEQALEVDRVDQLGQVAAVGRVPHRRSTPNIGAPRAFPQ